MPNLARHWAESPLVELRTAFGWVYHIHEDLLAGVGPTFQALLESQDAMPIKQINIGFHGGRAVEHLISYAVKRHSYQQQGIDVADWYFDWCHTIRNGAAGMDVRAFAEETLELWSFSQEWRLEIIQGHMLKAFRALKQTHLGRGNDVSPPMLTLEIVLRMNSSYTKLYEFFRDWLATGDFKNFMGHHDICEIDREMLWSALHIAANK
ncbi:hypothetical protein EJ05DRAFT_526449 [Pseudovirgaria hyperparasitica]|uniref:Uncharacterized protein n=1 Tax=Pseudovirgaria hyperparasitica TaxID=470096 RepID=A0A6A6WCY8_9PEZI|nr:uncharacterized protein EJ05DRAFT_526449 [Pseudovirgaria hyperparasitica]KAF2759716.1 hypothetical protein EJ05DRAFT_526449 [Pseudovirgaria hyperparasitica]